jgi:hypothetical protein
MEKQGRYIVHIQSVTDDESLQKMLPLLVWFTEHPKCVSDEDDRHKLVVVVNKIYGFAGKTEYAAMENIRQIVQREEALIARVESIRDYYEEKWEEELNPWWR